MTKKLLLTLSAVLALLAGCAAVPRKALDPEVRAKLQQVTISDQVTVSDNLMFFGAKQAAFGLIGGGLGAVAGQAVLSDEAVLRALLVEHQIKVGDMLKAEFAKQLREGGVFSVSDTGPAPQFRLTVTSQGLVKRAAFDGDMRAVVWANAALVDQDGTVLWQRSVTPPATEDRIPAYSFDHLKANPEVLRKNFEQIAALVAKELIEDLSR